MLKKKPTNFEIHQKEKQQENVDKITRIVAIVFVFVGVYYFFIKLLFL